MEEKAEISRLQKQLEDTRAQLLRAEGEIADEIAARKEVEKRLQWVEERLQAERAKSGGVKLDGDESDQFYKLLIENTHDAIYSVTPDGILTYLSPAMATQFGYASEELISKKFIEFVAPEQRQEVIDKFATGTAAGESFPTEFQWLHKDGSRVWIEVAGKTVFDEAGIPQKQIGVIRNIEERKKGKEGHRQLLLLLDILDAVGYIKDKDGVFQYINKAYENHFDVKREEVIGKDDDFVFGPEIGAILRENDQSIMAGKKTIAIEESGVLKSGRSVVYLTNKTPIIDDNGEVTGTCGAAIDITHQKEIEKQLLLSEEKYRVLVEKTYDVIYAIGVDGIIVYISQQIAQYGYSPEDVIGKHVSQFIAPEYREASLSTFREFTKTGESLLVRIPWLNKDGSYDWVEVVDNNVYDDSGRPIQRVGVMRNISGQMEIESALKENQQRLQLALAAGQTSLFELDILSGSARFDDLGYRIYGHEPGNFEPDLEFVIQAIHPEDAAWVVPEFFAALESPDVERFEAEYRFFRADGDLRWKRDQWIIIRDEGGKADRFVGAQVDITEQKQAQIRLQESQEQYRNLVEQISDVIYSIDLEGVFTYISPAIETLLGYNSSEVEGQSIPFFIDPEYLASAENNFRQLSTGEILGPNEYLVRTKSGEARWIRDSSYPTMRDDQVIGVQGVLTDITDRKVTETQLTQAAASAERERLARELHDSVTQTLYSVTAIAEALPRIWERNPLEAQIGLSELGTLTRAALAEMRTLLLELRPETLGKQNLAELLSQLVDGMVGRTRMPINLDIDGDICGMPIEVQIALYRITQEALNNIIKHARASHSNVNLVFEPGLVKLLVSDDGTGFNPQSVSSHCLGLDIMRERAQDIGAALNIDSQPESGTQISVLWHEGQE